MLLHPDEAKVGSGPISDRVGRKGEDQVEVEEARRTFVEVAKAKVERLGDTVWL